MKERVARVKESGVHEEREKERNFFSFPCFLLHVKLFIIGIFILFFIRFWRAGGLVDKGFLSSIIISFFSNYFLDIFYSFFFIIILMEHRRIWNSREMLGKLFSARCMHIKLFGYCRFGRGMRDLFFLLYPYFIFLVVWWE